jgi:hypothetical protein
VANAAVETGHTLHVSCRSYLAVHVFQALWGSDRFLGPPTTYSATFVAYLLVDLHKHPSWCFGLGQAFELYPKLDNSHRAISEVIAIAHYTGTS